MGSIGFLLHSPSNTLILSPALNSTQNPKKSRLVSRILASMKVDSPPSLGFNNLMETLTVDVQRAENRPLNVPLISPFMIASSRLERVENVAIRVELSNGCVGWGEAPVLPFVTAEDQPTAIAKASEACEFLRRSPTMALGSLLGEIGDILPGHEFASVSIN